MVSLLTQEQKDDLELAYRKMASVSIDSGASEEITEPLNDALRLLCHALEQNRYGLDFGRFGDMHPNNSVRYTKEWKKSFYCFRCQKTPPCVDCVLIPSDYVNKSPIGTTLQTEELHAIDICDQIKSGECLCGRTPDDLEPTCYGKTDPDGTTCAGYENKEKGVKRIE